MDIEIPSPSVFLKRSPVLPKSVPTPIKKSTKPPKPRGGTQTKSALKASQATTSASTQHGDITKPKQSKSRNGCMTCKKKRLKCDERKPSCAQCEKRNVECEGYKKDFKWRSFEETNQQSRVGKAKRTQTEDNQVEEPQTQEPREPAPQPSSSHSNEEQRWSPASQHVLSSVEHAVTEPLPPSNITIQTTSPHRFSPSHFDPLPILNPGFSPSDLDLPSPLPTSDSGFHETQKHGSSRSSFTAGSPALADILLPANDLMQTPDPSEIRPPRSPRIDEPEHDHLNFSLGIDASNDEDFDEEVMRDQPMASFEDTMSNAQWTIREPSPARSEVSTTSSNSTNVTLLKAPPLDPTSPEMLMLRFDRETCGILSIKDGPSENPWRTLIWPLAQHSHALYHAISAMAALHGGITQPQLRLAGMAHMTKSISKLSVEMHSMSLDQNLATALALALGEGWDDKVSTGIQHLKGAKILLTNILVQRGTLFQMGELDTEDAKRVKFLANTYVYLDAIARLTSRDPHDDADHATILETVNEPIGSTEYELDPLMGCATSLFPLLARVGSLVHKIRQTPTSSLTVVSEANDIREQLLHWEPPDIDTFERPEDPTSNVRHALQTAEAYRRAILLHLHSAVTELSSEPSHDQAKGILTMLAATPLSSRTLIVQIFPLLVGSCEMVHEDDRRWVTQRWEAMMQRLNLVNVLSCWQVVKEIWRRRDEWNQQQAQRMANRSSRTVSPSQFIPRTLKRKVQIPDLGSDEAFLETFGEDDDTTSNPRHHKRRVTFDTPGGLASKRQLFQLPRRHTDVSLLNGEVVYSVRGHLHWLGVMSDWGWEVFVG